MTGCWGDPGTSLQGPRNGAPPAALSKLGQGGQGRDPQRSGASGSRGPTRSRAGRTWSGPDRDAAAAEARGQAAAPRFPSVHTCFVPRPESFLLSPGSTSSRARLWRRTRTVWHRALPVRLTRGQHDAAPRGTGLRAPLFSETLSILRVRRSGFGAAQAPSLALALTLALVQYLECRISPVAFTHS